MPAISMKRIIDDVHNGLDFILKHELWNTTVNGHMFPRTVATGATQRRQYVVDSKYTALVYYKASLFEDCYINAYPDYDGLRRMGVITENSIEKYRYNHKPIPHHVVIDLDRDTFTTDEQLQTALTDTLTNIKTLVYGDFGRCPTVVHTGNGYHIHVLLNNWYDALDDMHDFKNFKELGSETLANKFMRFVERRLSNGSADQHHNLSIKSCMFRVPGTINTKAKAAGRDPIVKIIQSWALENTDGFGTGGARQALLDEFQGLLIQEVIDSRVEKLQRRRLGAKFFGTEGSNSSSSMPWWVDKLLQTGVDDGRKNLLYWLLAPYLITIRGLDYDKAYHILEGWLEKCDEVRSLDPGWDFFRYRIRYCLDTAEDQERKPIRFETFKEYYPDVYKKLSVREGA
jgi:Primase X